MKLEKIHQDDRGEIWVLMIDGREHTFLKSNKNSARGGCIHRLSQEHAVVLEGVVEYHIRGKKKRIYKKGESVLIEPNCPHYFVALEDSIVMEWGPSPDEKKEKHPQWRKVVDKINEKSRY
ncbi:MAG: cupin domain-containing protein [Candidatus Bathyarchaeota archaeon]|nr:cupin domain-containing protein [Candidatus Bathyarchaeota archaeon]